ncbi:uncharacterized protein [Melanerpes formicivorus]|uniref:uncharacterized protein isoform X1 n=1 Tax=Melanerpes formicivorus TaxID=211600 RepID=UPI00358F39CE
MERGWERSWERRGGSRGVAAGSGTPPERLQLVVLGAGGVGKSALSARFAQSYFVPHHAPTIEDSYSTLCTIDHLPACLHIVDTSGQEDFGVQRQQQLRGGEGFLLVFAIDDRRSFGALGRLLGQILQVKDREGTPVVLLGNKADLSPLRQVSREEAQAFARQHRLRYLETSAKTQLNVEEAFQELVRAVRRFRDLEAPPPATLPPPPPPRTPPAAPATSSDPPQPQGGAGGAWGRSCHRPHPRSSHFRTPLSWGPSSLHHPPQSGVPNPSPTYCSPPPLHGTSPKPPSWGPKCPPPSPPKLDSLPFWGGLESTGPLPPSLPLPHFRLPAPPLYLFLGWGLPQLCLGTSPPRTTPGGGHAHSLPFPPPRCHEPGGPPGPLPPQLMSILSPPPSGGVTQ